MKSFKDLTNELSEMKVSIEDLTKELHEVKTTIAESLKLATDAMNNLSESFSKDNLLKNLGIDSVIPDFLKKKK